MRLRINIYRILVSVINTVSNLLHIHQFFAILNRILPQVCLWQLLDPANHVAGLRPDAVRAEPVVS